MTDTESLGVIDNAGGLQEVLKNHRASYFRYLRLVAEVYGVLKLTAESERKVCPRLTLLHIPGTNADDCSWRMQSSYARPRSKMSN